MLTKPNLNELAKYKSNYTPNSFWAVIKKCVKYIGFKAAKQAIAMYYIIKRTDIPYNAKALVICCLGYLIAPFDLCPDMIPILGYSDDVFALALTYKSVAQYVDPNTEHKANQIVSKYLKE